jgi:hypothetical protein
MRERLEQILKIICLALAVLLAVQVVKAVIHADPLAGVVIPELPSLPADTNALVKVAAKGPMKAGTNMLGTNGPGAGMATNAAMLSKDTNGVTLPAAKESASNGALVQAATEPAATNKIRTHKAATNSAVAELATTNSAGTNIAATGLATTNLVETNIAVAELPGTNLMATNVVRPNFAATESGGTNIAGTNMAAMKMPAGTNLAAMEMAKAGGSNSVAGKNGSSKNPPMAMPMMMGGMPGMKAASLPPEIQARVDRVTESEIFGPVVHPMPMALLGIAGKMAFLRSPSGQTGLVKEGDDLGEIKLLRIGVNRVLVEQDGQKKELMIFSGFGGESLLPKPTESSDETTKH